MTGEIVNLRRARKAKARADHAATGAANRARSGLSRDVRDGEALRRQVLDRRLDGHRLDEPSPGDIKPDDDGAQS